MSTMRHAAMLLALLSAQVASRPYYKKCGSANFPDASFSAMGGTWSFTSSSSDVTAVGNTVTFSIPTSSVSGIWVQTSDGYPDTSSFTPDSGGCGQQGSTCSGLTNPDVVCSSMGTFNSGSVEVVVRGLNDGNCANVQVALGYSSGYAPGDIITNAFDMCASVTTTTTAATTTAAPTTTAATTTAAPTTTTAAAGGTSFDAYQFTSSDGAYNAYWYLIPFATNPTIKFFWSVDFSSEGGATDKWAGIGFKTTDSSMGPGFFYVGLSSDGSVLARQLESGSTYPGPASATSDLDPTVVDSNCEVEDDVLHCYVVRSVAGVANSTLNPDFNNNAYELAWAFGDLLNGGFGTVDDHSGTYHNSNRGNSDGTVDFLGTAPELPSLSGDEYWAAWTPTPQGRVDVFFATPASTDIWVGVGFGAGNDAMGPGEFYTGQSDTNAVTDRWLDSGSSYPPAKSSSNILQSGCSSNSGNFSCFFTRSLTATGSESEDLDDDVYIRWAHGDLSDGDISFHSAYGMASSTTALSSITAGSIDGGDSSGSLLYKVHGILMIVAWLFCLPYGIYGARFRDVIGMGKDDAKSGPPLWWRIHQPNQYIGVLLMIAAIVVIFVQAGPMTAEFLAGTFSGGVHEIVGITAFALTLMQPVFAFCRNGCCEDDSTTEGKAKIDSCHNVWHIIHAICGYGALVLALAAVGMGIAEIQYSADWPILFVAGFAVSVGAMFLFSVIAIALLFGKKVAKSKYTKDAEAQNESPRATSHPWLAGALFICMLSGAICCAVSVGTLE